MKKLVSLLLVALMLLGSAAALAESYTLDPANYPTEQGPIWFYRTYSEDEGEIRDLFYTPDWGFNWQFSATPSADNVYFSIFDWDGVHAQVGNWMGKPVDMILVFVAPKDGKATVDPGTFEIKADDGTGKEWLPHLVQVEHVSGETITPLLGEEFVPTPYEGGPVEVELKAGDELRFIVRKPEFVIAPDVVQDPDGNVASVKLQPTVTYAE